MELIKKLRKHGVGGSARVATRMLTSRVRRLLDSWRFRKAPHYVNPTAAELRQIEQDLSRLGVEIVDYAPAPEQFRRFQEQNWFPGDYHGGLASGVWDEKLLEHWIAGELLGLQSWGVDDIYVDIAACNSPWAKQLRERVGLAAFAIDLGPVGPEYKDTPYYRSENATQSGFENESVRGASLQCAYEMFGGEDDRLLVGELARILRPGGKVVILPLYMHTHYCTYSTSEYHGKGYSDVEAVEYIHLDTFGVPSSRKYDAQKLVERVLEPLVQAGMSYTLRVLRNKEALGKDIYCHFILEIEK